MKFVIKNPVVTDAPLDSFVIEYKTMRGDADGFSQNTVGPFKKGEHETHLENIIQVFKGIAEKFPSGPYQYFNVPGFCNWFQDDIGSMDDFYNYYPAQAARFTPEEIALVEESIPLAMEIELFPMWPFDKLAYESAQESLREWQVFYYDNNGVKHEVEMED